jgi:hypothetical protein
MRGSHVNLLRACGDLLERAPLPISEAITVNSRDKRQGLYEHTVECRRAPKLAVLDVCMVVESGEIEVKALGT